MADRQGMQKSLSKGAPGKMSALHGFKQYPRKRKARYDYKHRSRSEKKSHRISRKTRDRKFAARVKLNPFQRHRGPSNNLKRRLGIV